MMVSFGGRLRGRSAVYGTGSWIRADGTKGDRNFDRVRRMGGW